MQYRILLLASFVDKNHLHKFLYKLEQNHGIPNDKVFIYDIDEDTNLLTYKIKVNLGAQFNIKKELPKTIQIHKKQNTFFTINALNKLIEIESDTDSGNINHKQHKVDWVKYSDTILLIKDNTLEVTKIKRVFLSN